MKPMVNLNDLMEEQLRALYDGEKRITSALNQTLKKATNPKLKEIIKAYEQINEEQLLRLKQVFNLLFTQKRGEKCVAMDAMVEEVEKIIERSMESAVMDAGIITALQHIIHYKIAGYGAICNYATTLGLYEEARIMHENLETEKWTDRELADLAESAINLMAV